MHFSRVYEGGAGLIRVVGIHADGHVVAGEPAAVAEHLEPVAARDTAVEERLDAVDEANVASASLVVLAPRIGRDPSGYPVDIGIAGEEASQAEYLAAAAGELGAAPLVEVDALHSPNLAGRDLVLRLPVVVVVAFEIAASELDAAFTAGGHHLVGIGEPSGEGLFGADGGHVVPYGVQDDLAVGDDRQYGQNDVDVLLAQHLVVVGIARHAEPSGEDVEILRVGVCAGDDDATGVQVVGAGVLGALPAATDGGDAIYLVGHGTASWEHSLRDWVGKRIRRPLRNPLSRSRERVGVRVKGSVL